MTNNTASFCIVIDNWFQNKGLSLAGGFRLEGLHQGEKQRTQLKPQLRVASQQPLQERCSDQVVTNYFYD